ncbi:substrate-binding domain-containing protein [Streptomyces sp. NPDC058739]|uniref:caspase, EACC1-associated type n=1 Tax=Streptomyces sp. NPDC058739 TaxID=3346618 RepID=UPI00368F5415
MTQPDPVRSRAVIIGVNAYAHMAPLPSVANSVSDLAALLSAEDLWGVRQPGHCRVLLNPANDTVVLEALRKAASEAEDALVVYFAGHGRVSREGKLFLALPSSSGNMWDLYLSYDDVRRVVETDATALQKVVILDCCYSGAAMGAVAMGDEDDTASLAAVEGAYLLTSSHATQVSKVFPGARHPAFSGALISAIEEGVEYGGSLLDMETLFTNVVERLSKVKECPVPQAMALNRGPRIALVRNRNPAPPVSRIPRAEPGLPTPTPPPAEPPPRPGGRRGLVLAGVAATLGAIALAALWPPPGPKPPRSLPVCTEPHPEEIHMAASADLSGTLSQAAKDYKPRKSGTRCFSIVVDEQNSGTTMRALAAGWPAGGEPRPDIWSPAGTIWLQLAKDRANSSTRKLFPEESPEPIVTSPLVIAVPEPMANVLKATGKPIGWRTLAEAARDAKTFWASLGKPEYGEFKLGKTNPGYSTSGLNATVATTVAATGISTGLTPQDITSSAAERLVRDTERAVVHYGDTTLTFMENLRRADDTAAADPDAALRYISAVTVEEQAVVAYNLGYPCGTFSDDAGCERRPTPPHTPLVAIYPSDGVLYSDHPFIELTTMSPEKKAVADGFAAHLRTSAVQKKFDQLGFRTWDNRPTPLIEPANGAVVNPPIRRLPLPEPAVLGTLLDAWPKLRKRAHVSVLIDTSGSMAGHVTDPDSPSKMNLLKQAAPQLFGRDGFTDDDQVGLWQFGDTDENTVPMGPMKENWQGGPRRQKLIDAFAKLRPDGATALYKCIGDAVDDLRADYDPSAINAVVVLTDGRNDPKDVKGLDTLKESLRDRRKPVRVFTIAYGDGADEQVTADKSVLEEIAEASDGHPYDAKDRPADIADILVNVISNF